MLQTVHAKAKKWFLAFCAIITYSLAMDLFFVHNQIVSGGFAGLAMVICSLLPISIGAFLFILNIPCLILSFFLKGKEYTISTLILTLLFSVAVDALACLPSVTSNKFLAAIFGGVLYGIGSALLVKARLSTGGSDLFAKLMLLKYKNLSLGKMYLCIDCLVVLLSVVVYRDPESCLYAILAIYTYVTVTDHIIDIFNNACNCIIISNKDSVEISNVLLHHLGRGVTQLQGIGMYAQQEKNVYFVTVRPYEVAEVRKLVQLYDPHAFMLVEKVTEVLGSGFENLNDENTTTIQFQQKVKSLQNQK